MEESATYHNEIMAEMKYLRRDFQEHITRMEIYMMNSEKRLRTLEDWKLTFVTKFSIYSAIALFFGSALATLAVNLILKRI